MNKLKNKFNLNVSSQKGMTLIEILLVSALISVVSIALYKSFNSGLKVWQRSKQIVVEEDVAIFFDRISLELKNTYKFSKIGFKGDQYKFSFPTFIKTLPDLMSSLPKDEYINKIGKVEYFYDFNENKLYRREANYSQALNNQYMQARVILENVNKVEFKYYYVQQNQELLETETLDGFPSGVNIEVEIMDKSNKRYFKKLIDIPLYS